MKGILWLKRDFRLHDNPALRLALSECDCLLILYILEPTFINSKDASVHHFHAIGQAYDGLRLQLKEQHVSIYFVEGEAVETFSRLYQLQKYNKVYSHQETGVGWTFKRDLAVAKWLKSNNVKWEEPIQTGVFRRLKNRDDRTNRWNEFYHRKAFTPPSRNELERITCPDAYLPLLKASSLTEHLKSHGLTTQKSTQLQKVSEIDGLNTFHNFLYERGYRYRGNISSPNTAYETCSRISVHLAWGTLSPRYVYQKTLERKEEIKKSTLPNKGQWLKSLDAFLSRVHWRDHFIQRLETEPDMEHRALNPAFRSLQYDDDPIKLATWTNGKTGFPLVDAVIRCFHATGFSNFRMRAMITSFASHSLHLDWRKIHFPLAQWFLDYEPGIHFSQLQMQASVVGINAVRVYSPTKQLIDQDPDCTFVKKWIPELRDNKVADIVGHSSYPLGDYPGMIINHKIESKKMKDRIWEIKRQSETPSLSQAVYQKHGSRKRPNRSKFIKRPRPPKQNNQLSLDFGDL